ncbi:MAG TPA: ABC transporter substrate-binding protein, partial [Myxococcaceae bacterium]|nr:ABC transporter substrate-binding protein [Myxococcaceae bacterium]
VADVVWIHEFARAGWIADLSAAFPPERMARDFLRSTAESAVFRGKTFAVPYYADVGLLYYRRDLVPSPPTTYAALEEAVLEARVQDRSMQGYLWQGKQYEGLVCNAFEAVWGHGGTPASGETLTVASPEAAAGLETLRGWVERGVSPRSVTSAAEEDTRRAFQQGSAVFQRNWPYAWAEMQKEDSPVCGRVGVAPLPTLAGEPGAGTLGGYQLAVNAHSPPEKRALVTALLAHLTSPDAYLTYALHYGRNPPMRSVYQDPRLRKGAPFTASLLPHLERARARPLTPYYNLISDALQGEFSAAVAGLRSPKEALARAQRRIDHLTKG